MRPCFTNIVCTYERVCYSPSTPPVCGCPLFLSLIQLPHISPVEPVLVHSCLHSAINHGRATQSLSVGHLCSMVSFSVLIMLSS